MTLEFIGSKGMLGPCMGEHNSRFSKPARYRVAILSYPVLVKRHEKAKDRVPLVLCGSCRKKWERWWTEALEPQATEQKVAA